MWQEVQCLLLVLGLAASLDSDNDVSFYQGSTNTEVKCRCVPYWLCENNYINTDGSEVLKPRQNIFECDCGECPNKDDICCFEPPGLEGLSWDKCGINKYWDEDYDDEVSTRVLAPNRKSTETRFAEFPWTLMLLREKKLTNGTRKQKVFHGGASIIHRQVALTVAHAVAGVDNKLVKVRAGEWNAASISEEIVHQERGVRQIIIHPSYDKASMYNDIALLILDAPLQIADNVAPICLPDPNLKYNSTNCWAAGWGRNAFGDPGRYQTTLRKVHLPLVSNRQCEQQLGSTPLGPRFRLHRSFLCAGGKQGQDTCQGDGGGPLMCRTTDDRYVQVGIVSWGIKCGNAYPGVYTNLLQFVNWINSTISGALA